MNDTPGMIKGWTDAEEQRFLRADNGEQPSELTVRSFVIRASTANEQARTVDAVLATEAPTYVFDRRSWTMIREMLLIGGQSWPSQVPLLDTHDCSTVRSQLGSTRNLRVEGNELIGTRHFSSVVAGVEAFTKVKEGHLTGGSIGYIPRGYTDLEPGASFQANGRTITNDGSDTLRVTFDFVVMEDSVAAIGRDSNAKTRSLNQPTPQGKTMTIEELVALYGAQHRALITKLHTEGKKHDAIAQAVLIAERALGAAAPAVPPAADETVRAQTIASERARIAGIRTAASTDISPELVNRAIDEGWTVERANGEFLAEMRRARPTPVGHGGAAGGQAAAHDPIELVASSEDKCVRAIECALSTRAFSSNPSRAPKFTTEQQAEAVSLRGIGLQDIARLTLRASRQAAPINIDTLFARAVSTYAFPVALGNTLNRVIQNAYETAESSLMKWAAVGSVKDFREHKNIKLGKYARPVKVGKGGQFEHGTLSEEAEGFSASTYATAFVISRHDFINDDLGIFDRVAPELGNSMHLNIDDIGYELLVSAAGLGPTMDADSVALFNGSRSDGSNYITGAATTLTSAGLTELKKTLRLIKQNARQLNLVPKFLLVPAALEQAALELVKSSAIVVAGATDVVRGASNVHQGTLQVIVEPRLDAGTNGTTAWYLVCEPMRAKSLQVSFLNGNQSPTIERRDPANVLGLGWLAYHDVGVDAVDWRGIARSKGAA